MSEDRYVAAIEISSSKIIAVVGKLRPTNQLDIIACEQDKGVEGVRYGVIQNLEDTSLRIQHLITSLQRRSAVYPREITGVYVGLSGRSLRAITTEVSKNLPDDTEITNEIIAELRAQALHTAIDSSLEVVDAIPRIFKVGKTETTSPKGMVGNSIKGTYDLIVCRPELKKNLIRTLHDKLGIRINGAMVTALSTGQLVLKAEEKRLGCMLVDMGSETTTVTIYKSGHLRYFATLPLGGRNITRDIASLPTLLEDKAEDMKTSSGDAIARDSISSVNINGYKMSDVSNLVVARSEEIVANVIEQIAYAGLTEKDLQGGIICIGGGSQLRGMLELMGNLSGLTVRRGQLPSYIRIEDTKSPSVEVIEVASVLFTGATNNNAECLVIPQREDLPINGESHPDDPRQDIEDVKARKKEKKKKKGPSALDKWATRLSSFFTGNDDDEDDIID